MEVTKIVFSEEEDDVVIHKRPSFSMKKLTKQKSEKDMTREALWERRRRQMLRREWSSLKSSSIDHSSSCTPHEDLQDSTEVDVPCGGEGDCLRRLRSVTKADMDDLRGSIELGFGFEEEAGGHELCNTLPALDLYFAINRSSKRLNYTPSPESTPTRARMSSSSSLFSLSSSSSSTTGTISPSSPRNHDSWKLLQPGDTPEHIKTKLRHWARVVACTAEQSV